MIQIRLNCAELVNAAEGAEFLDIEVPAHQIWQPAENAPADVEMIVFDGHAIYFAMKRGDQWIRDNGDMIDAITHAMPAPEFPGM